MAHLREIVTEEFRIQLDLGEQILALDLPEHSPLWHYSAIENHDVPISPTLPEQSRDFVSAAALLLKAKQFDDGLYGNRPIPEGFDLMNELIERIRTHRLQLQPREESGWYDHQLWSLEPLILPEETPEGRHLQIDPGYRKHLIDLFKAVYALTRETHAKQLAVAGGGCGMLPKEIFIAPELDAEPLATCYLRRMLSYRFLRQVLQGHFGADALAGLCRLTPRGKRPKSLAEEHAEIESLFLGAYVVVCRQLGMELDPVIGEREAEDATVFFGRWKQDIGNDEDLSSDARMMVPVFYDVQRRKTKVWMFLGWTISSLTISFARRPGVVCFERIAASPPAGRLEALRQRFRGQPEQPQGELPRLSFTSCYHPLATPVMAEVYVDKLLDRDEFRKHCERYKTYKGIVENLR